MKIWWVVLAAVFWCNVSAAQVGRISANGNVNYSTEAQELRRQRASAPTYEQLLPPQQQSTSAERQQAAQEILDTQTRKAEEKDYIAEKIKVNQPLSNYGDQKEARNLMVVRAVANYKSGDEKLAKQYEKVEENAEFQRKMEQIMEKLSNAKMRNTKNKQVIKILDDAGNRLYNLLAN